MKFSFLRHLRLFFFELPKRKIQFGNILLLLLGQSTPSFEQFLWPISVYWVPLNSTLIPLQIMCESNLSLILDPWFWSQEQINARGQLDHNFENKTCRAAFPSIRYTKKGNVKWLLAVRKKKLYKISIYKSETKNLIPVPPFQPGQKESENWNSCVTHKINGERCPGHFGALEFCSHNGAHSSPKQNWDSHFNSPFAQSDFFQEYTKRNRKSSLFCIWDGGGDAIFTFSVFLTSRKSYSQPVSNFWTWRNDKGRDCPLMRSIIK